MNKDINDLIPEVTKNPEAYDASFNVWKDHKVVLDELKSTTSYLNTYIIQCQVI